MTVVGSAAVAGVHSSLHETVLVGRVFEVEQSLVLKERKKLRPVELAGSVILEAETSNGFPEVTQIPGPALKLVICIVTVSR